MRGIAAGLRGRIGRLEASGGGDCPRCSGVFAVTVNGRFSSASKHGEPMPEEGWRAFEAEEEDGRCPECERRPTNVTIGSPAPASP